MVAFRVAGQRGGVNTGDMIMPGDTQIHARNMQTITSASAVTITATQLLSGNIMRSGPLVGYTDVLPTAVNVLAGLNGGSVADITPGAAFDCRITNNTGTVETLTLGTGMVAGQGSIASIAANSWRDFQFDVTSNQAPLTVIANTTSGSAVVTWSLPPGQTTLQQGNAYNAVNIIPGAGVSGTGITAGTTNLGLTAGVGGSIGATLSGTATATGTNIALTFGPVITAHSSGSGAI